MSLSGRRLGLGLVLICAPFAYVESAAAGDASKKETGVTYAKEVSRILQERCQTCHHAGTAAPFSLLSYDDAKHWSDSIKEAVTEKRMPPWHADPKHGKFSNDRRLNDTEKKTLLAWIDQGCPLGDKKDLPAPKTYADGWVIGKPDVVLEMPETYEIQAKGTVPYKYFRTKTNFKEDVWIQAAEARPGNRAVVHHIIIGILDPKAGMRRGGGGGPGGGGGGGPGGGGGLLGEGFLVGTAPGDMPQIFPPGIARKIPAGAELIWQMHYTPTGKPEKDRSQVALIFYKGKEPPKHAAHTRGIANPRLNIPPGAANQMYEVDWSIPNDMHLLSFMPHMHLRGKDFEYKAIYPDGHSEVLLNVPKFDFNWQTSYRLAKPVLLPKGTKIHCTAHFDNSANNPANPDPTKTVRWGDQTWEEMMIGWVDYYWDKEPASAPKAEPKKAEPAKTVRAGGTGS